LAPVLNLHHIFPVRLGGAASDRNLVAICPNCHSSIHYLSRSKHPDVIARKVARLISAGYTEMQSELIRLIASHDAHVLEDGTIEPYKDPAPTPFIIVDAPDVDPAAVRRYEAVIAAREKRAAAYQYDSPIERGGRAVEARKKSQQENISL
jgi:hypothetical protein